MATVNRKCIYVLFVCLWALSFFTFSYTTMAQTTNTPEDNTIQNTLLSFSIEKTPIVAQHIGDTMGSAPTLSLNRDVRIESKELILTSCAK